MHGSSFTRLIARLPDGPAVPSKDRLASRCEVARECRTRRSSHGPAGLVSCTAVLNF
jgi:hypothetical protein